MAENIVINFDANVQDLTKTIDLLEKMGLVAKKDADAFRTMNATTNQTVQSQNAVQKELTETEKALQGVTKEATKASTTVENAGKKNGFKSAASDIGGLESGLKKIGGMIAGAFAIERVIAFGAESVKAFQEAEKNALILKAAVTANGGLQSDFEDLIKQSEELQDITIFSDDAIQKVQTAALQFGLQKDQVKALLPVLADYASATGKDLNGALEAVLQGVNGLGKELKQSGVFIDETQTKTERLEDISKQLTRTFEGQAKVIGETSFGAAEKYRNKIDDLQEKIGKDLAPTIAVLQLGLLKTADTFLKVSGGASNLAVELGKLSVTAGATAATIAERLSKIGTALPSTFDENFNKLKAIYKKKFDTTSLEDLSKKYIELGKAQEKLTGDARTRSLAQQAAIGDLLKEKAAVEGVTGSTKEKAEALAKLADIANRTDKELLAIKKTLQSFNDANLADEIELIDKTIEARAKAGEKRIADEQKAIEALNELQKKAAQDREKIEAASVDKATELEVQKQQEILKIKEAFAKAGSPEAELKETEKAIQDVTDAYGVLIDAANKEAIEIKVKIDKAKIQSNFDEIKTVLENEASQEEIDLKIKFLQEGDFSDEAVKKLASDTEDIYTGMYDRLIMKASAYGIEKADIDKMIADNNKKRLDKEVADGKDASDEIIKTEKEALEERKAIAAAIVDLAKGTIDAIADVTNAYYEQRIDQIDRDKERILESYDEQLDANEELHSKNKKGDRQYENDKKKLEAERKKAEEKADKEKRKLMREQAVFNKAIAITNSIINTAVAVTANLAVPVVAALVAILGAIEVAAIIAQPIPAYAKGKERIEGRGTETSDEVPARLSVGERVVRASTNRKYFPILSAIHHERFDPETMNSLSRFSPETLRKLATVDQSLIHDLATMQPVFMKHVSNVPDVRFRNDITPRMQSAHLLQMVNYNVAAGMNEYDMSRALKKGTKVDNVKEIAKEVGKEIIENMGENIRRKI